MFFLAMLQDMKEVKRSFYSVCMCAFVAHLHGGVIQGYEGGEQVQVASGEHQGEEDLALSRDTWKRRETTGA